MSDTTFERLITDGFLFEGLTLRGFTLRADYGGGYVEGALTDTPDGLLTWKIKIGALPNFEGEDLIDAGEFGLQTRFDYLFNFYRRHNVAAAWKPFWVRCPATKRDYLAEIVESQLELQMFSALVFGVGLTIRQRRVFGVESVGDVVMMDNNAEI